MLFHCTEQGGRLRQPKPNLLDSSVSIVNFCKTRQGKNIEVAGPLRPRRAATGGQGIASIDMARHSKNLTAHQLRYAITIFGGCDWTRTNDLFDVNEAL